MNLEKRTLNWIDLGTTNYGSSSAIQKVIVDAVKNKKMGDTVLSMQHYPEINFGTDNRNNQFSDSLLSEVREAFGPDYSSTDIEEHLSKRNIKFSRSDRGGGVTVFSPGQLIYYLILDYGKLSGNSLDVGGYKSKIYSIMFETLKNLGIEGINTGATTTTRDERRDVWVNRNGKSLKMGSKGIRIEQGVTSHGFALYIDRSSTENFNLINPCGYNSSEVFVTSVEAELGKPVQHNSVHRLVGESIKKHLGYSGIKFVNFNLENVNNALEVAS